MYIMKIHVGKIIAWVNFVVLSWDNEIYFEQQCTTNNKMKMRTFWPRKLHQSCAGLMKVSLKISFPLIFVPSIYIRGVPSHFKRGGFIDRWSRKWGSGGERGLAPIIK